MISIFILTITILACSNDDDAQVQLSNSEKALALIDALETGDTKALDYVSESYTQHNLSFPDGKAVIAGLLTGTPTGFTSTNYRIFEEGNYVFMHNSYGGSWNNGVPQVAFDIFRFENGSIVEHWDNLSDITPENPSGRTQVDGATSVTDLGQTAANKTLVEGFVTDILLNGKADKLTDYISAEVYIQHNSGIADGLEGLGEALQFFADNDLLLQYDKLHAIFGTGNFVLTVSEGLFLKGDHVAYYDLFRVDDGKIVEHWDVIQNIPPESEWENINGKFGFN